MRTFQEYTIAQEAAFLDFVQFVEQNYPDLYNEINWGDAWGRIRGYAGAATRGLAQGARSMTGNLAGGAAQTIGGGLGLAGAGIRAMGGQSGQGPQALSALKQMGHGAAGMTWGATVTPAMKAAQSFAARDVNSTIGHIKTISDPGLRNALQQAFNQWQQQQQNPNIVNAEAVPNAAPAAA